MMFKKPILIISIVGSLLLCLLNSGPVLAYTYQGQGVWGETEYAQSGNVRSESDIIREVKQRYNAEVLRISYNAKAKAYKVRVLMPNGKVRNLTISARR